MPWRVRRVEMVPLSLEPDRSRNRGGVLPPAKAKARSVSLGRFELNQS
jgi:hypothetical protein